MGLSGFTRTSFARRMVAFVLVLALAAILLPVSPARAQADTMVYFEHTGQTLGGALYEVWELEGGLSQLGEPVSPVIDAGGRWVQWFRYARLDVTSGDPSQASESDIFPAPIGRIVADQLGLSRWHPAFQPSRGPISLGGRSFAAGFPLENGFRDLHERTGVADRLGAPISREFSLHGTTYQFFQGGAMRWTEQDGVGFAALGILAAALHGELRLRGDQPEGVPAYEAETRLAAAGGGERWIDINLSSYLLTAYEGSIPVLQTYIVDGGWDTPTVRGTFYIYSKLDVQTMRGARPDGSEYITEDVPWVMYFYADYAIHGAYWRSSFGYSASQGCVNVPVSTAAWLYGWAGYGTRVVVHG
jgi:hypothetical protein